MTTINTNQKMPTALQDKILNEDGSLNFESEIVKVDPDLFWKLNEFIPGFPDSTSSSKAEFVIKEPWIIFTSSKDPQVIEICKGHRKRALKLLGKMLTYIKEGKEAATLSDNDREEIQERVPAIIDLYKLLRHQEFNSKKKEKFEQLTKKDFNAFEDEIISVLTMLGISIPDTYKPKFDMEIGEITACLNVNPTPDLTKRRSGSSRTGQRPTIIAESIKNTTRYHTVPETKIMVC
jgi:hypothetical protein